MRTKLRWVVTAAVLLVLAAGAYLVGESLWRQSRLDVVQKALDVLPGVAQHLQNFRRVQTEGGRTVWEVSADDARFFAADNIIMVRKPLIAWYPEEGRRLGLQGDEGRVVLEGNDVRFVEMRGKVEVDLAEFRVEVGEAVYDRELERITAPGGIVIAGPNIDARGDDVVVELGERRLTVMSNVAMTLQPGALAQGAMRDLP